LQAGQDAVEPVDRVTPGRSARVVLAQHVGEMIQAEIAAQVGLSQMDVSRLLQRVLTQLRTGMLAD
jgi:RNA polymerase sigma-B factor